MDLPDPGPARPAQLIQPLSFSTLLVLLFLVSCREKEESPVPIKKSIADTNAILQQQVSDSLSRVEQSWKKKIYLTFDDGPNAGTMNVLEAVKAEQVPVSFFIVAKHTRDSREQRQTWATIKATPGIEYCNHSYSHAGNRYSRFYQHPEEVIADFKRSQDSLHFPNTVARMPGRNAWRIGTIKHTDVKESKAAIDSVYSAGFNVMGWDLEWGFDHQSFAPDTDTALLFRRMENLLRDSATRTPGHLVLLAHDQAFRNAEDVLLLKGFLSSLKNNKEYELVLASGYPGVR